MSVWVPRVPSPTLAVKAVADRLANDIDEGAAPTLYRLGVRGGPVLIGRSVVAFDSAAAAHVVTFAEESTGTVLSGHPTA